jgi:hypothetical protein
MASMVRCRQRSCFSTVDPAELVTSISGVSRRGHGSASVYAIVQDRLDVTHTAGNLAAKWRPGASHEQLTPYALQLVLQPVRPEIRR